MIPIFLVTTSERLHHGPRLLDSKKHSWESQRLDMLSSFNQLRIGKLAKVGDEAVAHDEFGKWDGMETRGSQTMRSHLSEWVLMFPRVLWVMISSDPFSSPMGLVTQQFVSPSSKWEKQNSERESDPFTVTQLPRDTLRDLTTGLLTPSTPCISTFPTTQPLNSRKRNWKTKLHALNFPGKGELCLETVSSNTSEHVFRYVILSKHGRCPALPKEEAEDSKRLWQRWVVFQAPHSDLCELTVGFLWFYNPC